MAKSGEYDAIFYGHNHLRKREKIGETWVVNPGEICAQKTGECSFAIYDSISNEVEMIIVENSISLKSDLVDNYFRENFEKLGFRSEASFKIDDPNT